MTAASIARLRIKLDDVEPAVVRRVEVPLTIRLDRLHLVLQAAMGWTNSHLYEIRARDVGWGRPDPHFGDGPLDASKARLIDVLEDVGTRSLKYLYDFGDGWQHSIRIERITDAVPGMAYPCLIEAAGHCPPEDVGGPWGYRDFLEAIADPNHQEHAERLEWIGHDFDPNNTDVEALAQAVHGLAKKWNRSSSPVSVTDPGFSADGYSVTLTGEQLRRAVRAPSAGTYEQRNVLGTPTGVRIEVAQDEVLPAAPRGFTWRKVDTGTDL